MLQIYEFLYIFAHHRKIHSKLYDNIKIHGIAPNLGNIINPEKMVAIQQHYD